MNESKQSVALYVVAVVSFVASCRPAPSARAQIAQYNNLILRSRVIPFSGKGERGEWIMDNDQLLTLYLNLSPASEPSASTVCIIRHHFDFLVIRTKHHTRTRKLSLSFRPSGGNSYQLFVRYTYTRTGDKNAVSGRILWVQR